MTCTSVTHNFLGHVYPSTYFLLSHGSLHNPALGLVVERVPHTFTNSHACTYGCVHGLTHRHGYMINLCRSGKRDNFCSPLEVLTIGMKWQKNLTTGRSGVKGLLETYPFEKR